MVLSQRVRVLRDLFSTSHSAMHPARLSAKIYTDGQASPLGPVADRSIAVTTAYAQSVAHLLLSTTTGVHTSIPSIEEEDVGLVQATYIPWAPLAVFFGLVVLYAIVATWIAVSVWMGIKGMSAFGGDLRVSAERLASPSSLAFDISPPAGIGEKEVQGVRLSLGRKVDGGFGVHAAM